MLALQAGDRVAFDSIVLHYEHAVRQFIGRYVSDAARAEDLAQESFLRVYRARKRYEPTAKFRTWLFTIATRLCLNEIRSRARQQRVFVTRRPGVRESIDQEAFGEIADRSLETPPERVEREELERLIQSATDDLPGNQRAVVLLLRFEDCSYAEIGAILDVSPRAVKSLVNRARENLRRALHAHLPIPRRTPRSRKSPQPTRSRSKRQ